MKRKLLYIWLSNMVCEYRHQYLNLSDNLQVNLDSLIKDGLLTGARTPLKVLGSGDLKVKLTVHAAAFSASARAKIEAAGGSCEILD